MPETWRERLDTLPEGPDDPGGRVLILSAHPDDEVLAVGAWLADQHDREVVFVTATDGEGSHPQSTTISPDELRAIRPVELETALGHLGFAEPRIHRLRLPDGGLADSHAEVREAIEPFVVAADLVLAPFEIDGHPDHDALGRAVREVCPPEVALWRFPIWTWAWTQPGEQTWVPSARRLTISEGSRDRKRRAIAAFTTQVEPVGDDAAVVDGELLLHALDGPEVVVV